MTKDLVVSCTSGLCNRMHGILGSYLLSKQLGRKLKVLWINNAELGVEFHDIFDTDIELITEADFLYKVSRLELTVKVYNSGFSPYVESSHVCPDDPHDMVVVKPWYLPHVDGQEFAKSHIKDLQGAYTKLDFRRELVELAEPLKYANHVGIHIRYGDPTSTGTVNHQDYFQASTVDSFKCIMRSLCEKTPNTRFYIATPMESIKHELAKEFNVDFIETVTGRGPAGIKNAVVDLLNLCGCSMCCGSEHSQFTKMVSVRTGKPVIVVTKDGCYYDLGGPRPTTLEEIFSLMGSVDVV
jgi:hypothetical protein